jgi:hypothetical protein
VAQDDVRENRLVDLFNLVRPPGRTRQGTDASLLVDGQEIEFELKSVTTARASVSTVRDLGPDHIAKWQGKHWLIAFFDELDLRHCKYGSPEQMAPWISQKREYIRVDLEMAELVPGLINKDVMTRIIGQKDLYTLADARRLHKNQYSIQKFRSLMDHRDGYSPERMLEIFRERATYVIKRGSTLNNPHIPLDYFDSWETISDNYAATLRELVRRWRASVPVQQLARDDRP